jgi:MarR family transcriptional regulator, organic hydroperoxide resistance regulator
LKTEPHSVAPARELLYSFREVHRSMNRLMRIEADRLDLTPVQMLVIRTLAEESNLSLSELAERIQLGCSTVSGVVKRLVDYGVVDRNRLDEDQRTVAIRLTEKGRQLENRVFGDDSRMSKVLTKLLQFPENDIQTLIRLHRELIRMLDID